MHSRWCEVMVPYTNTTSKKNFLGCYVDVQDQHIRSQLVERSWKIYNMPMFWENNFFVRPRPGVPYTTTLKKNIFFLVAMDTFKTNIFELISSRGVRKYILCLCSEKIIFSLGLELGYPILLNEKKNSLVAMETSKTMIFGLISFFWSNWYIICIY